MLGLILLFLTPTILAIVYVYDVKNETANTFSVTLYDKEEREIAFESGNPDEASQKSLLGIFYQIASATDPLEQAPGDPETDSYILARCTLNGVESQWTCYFSFRESDSYCIASDGTVYAIDKTVTKNFLSTAHAELFYDSAIPPTLLTIDNDPVLPSAVTWYYQNRSETFLESQNPPKTEDTLRYEMTGELGLRFDVVPDTCQVSVYDGTREIFNGSYRELPSLTVELGSVMEIKVQAEWEQQPDTEYYGTIEYHFTAQIRNQSNFSVNSDTVAAGSFAILSCTNITDLSKIQFTPASDNVIPSPIFHRDGDYVRALLVFPADTEVEEFSFSVSYGASQQSFSVSVLPNPEPQQFFHPTWSADPSLLTTDAFNRFSEILSSLPTTEDAKLYFRGNFLNPTDYGFSIGYTHGSQVYYGEALSDSFTAIGSEFRTDAAGGARVLSLNHGIVLMTGECELLGRFVVVDHGCGLRTWYCHMGDRNVEEGDVVKKGDILGWTGTGGIATGAGTLILCTVYDTVIDPASVIGKEIVFHIPT